MKTTSLLLTGLNITEDDYDYKGQFILKSEGKSKKVDFSELSADETLKDIKAFFDLDDNIEQIRESLMVMIMEKSNITSKINEGENYEERSKRFNSEKAAKSLDLS